MSNAHFLPGDALPDAPALAARGPHGVGVTTRAARLADAIDLERSVEGGIVRGARMLPLEVWYPAEKNHQTRCRYSDRLGRVADDPDRPNTAFEFAGRAARDAAALDGRYPLVVVAHGYPGSRVLLSYLCEHLASTGHVVAAIDHVGSVHGAVRSFAETLLHRPTDILGTVDAMAGMDREDALLGGRIDADRTVLVGYSMGGYGALNAAGAALCSTFVDNARAVPNRLLAHRAQGAFEVDPRVRAVVAFAPWGGRHRVWDAHGLRGLKVPTLFVAGEDDDVVGWKPGVHSLFAGTSAAERFLLVYEQARHNVAPNPPPDAAASHPMDWGHYAEPIWDLRRLNNTNQHFVRAFIDYALGPRDRLPDALNLTPLAADGEIGLDAQGAATAGTGHWWGFAPRTALGMQFHRLREGH